MNHGVATLNVSNAPRNGKLPALLGPTRRSEVTRALFVPTRPPTTPARRIRILNGNLSICAPPPLTAQNIGDRLDHRLRRRRLARTLNTFGNGRTDFEGTLLNVTTRSNHRLNRRVTIARVGATLTARTRLRRAIKGRLNIITSAPSATTTN